ncbi:MAG: hypothetical protein ACTSRZ_05145 [Promethearchaeota archaeon]
MKFRVVLKGKTLNGYDFVFKVKVPPSKHQGLLNFLKQTTREDNPNKDVEFTVEMLSKDKKRVESLYFGRFRWQKRKSIEEAAKEIEKHEKSKKK